MKTLVIGDIHGCFTELQDLLEKAGIADDDRVIALGDIVDRGPTSVEVLDFFIVSPSRLSLMGNHERKHIRGARHEVRLALSQIISRKEFGAAYSQALEWMAGFPLFMDLPEAVLTHGYMEPGLPLESQRDTVLCGTMTGDQYLRKTYDQPWYALYDGSKPMIVGHRDYQHNGQPFIFEDRVYGLDTSCVHGGMLTGLLLPDFKVVSVPSRCNYWRETRQRYALANPPAPAAPPRRFTAGGWDGNSDHILEQIAVFARAESQRILAKLKNTSGYFEWTSRQQAKAYAAAAGRKMPWSALLNLARVGELEHDAVRRMFPSQAEAQDLLNRLSSENNGDQGENGC